MRGRNTTLLLVILLLSLIIGAAVSCSGGGKDDDNGANDDETVDDDVDDDSTTDDDTSDDDTTNDVWTDSISGLTWQVTPSGNYMSWNAAKSYCDSSTLAGGGWRLPTISELRTLIRGCDATVTGGSCGVTDSCLNESCWNALCRSCNNGDGPNNGCYGPAELPGECDSYWSSSSVAGDAVLKWIVRTSNGSVSSDYVDNYDFARCVR